MAKSLLEEIVNQLIGRKTKKSKQKPHYHNKAQRQADLLLYQMKKNAFEVKKQSEIMKHKAKSKGWI